MPRRGAATCVQNAVESSATSVEIAFETSKGPERGTYIGVLLWDLVQKAGLANAGGRNAELRHSLMVTGADGYGAAGNPGAGIAPNDTLVFAIKILSAQ